MSKKNTLKDENVMIQQLQGGETVFYTGRRGDSIEVINIYTLFFVRNFLDVKM